MGRLSPLHLANLLILPFLLGITSACGEFSNSIFRPGETTVEGVLLGSFQTEQAWVSVGGRPDLLATVDENGHFELEGVPTGVTVLIASDGEQAAARMEITLYNERRRQLELPMRPGLRVDGEVLLSSAEVQWATVSVLDLPVPITEVTSPRGHFQLEALPWGCHDLEFAHPGYANVLKRVCGGSSETRPVTAMLIPIPAGAAATCELCTTGEACASGLCVPAETGNGSERICAVLCRDDIDCPGAYACRGLEGSQARVCRPADASCQAVLATVESLSCTQDLECGEAGLCLAGTCTLECDTDESCPGGARCVAQGPDPISVCE